MSDWPLLDELKQVLDVDPTSDAWDGDYDETRLTRLLEAAIAYVKDEVGDWDETYDFPDASLAQAALRRAELMALRPEAVANIKHDPTYAALMKGKHRTFGIG